MCGRVRLSTDVSEIKIAFRVPPERATPNFPPIWNAPPTTDLPVVRRDPRDGQRSLDLLRWGLIPYWAKDPKIGFTTFNAKAEGIETKPAFRDAYQKRRCLVPIDNFYEWQKIGKDRQPYAVARADGELMALAGLWEGWRSPNGEWLRSFTIVTTSANPTLALLHERMPVILDPDAWPAWLGEEEADAERLISLMVPYPEERLKLWPVDKRVGNVKNNDAGLIERVEPEADSPSPSHASGAGPSLSPQAGRG